MEEAWEACEEVDVVATITMEVAASEEAASTKEVDLTIIEEGKMVKARMDSTTDKIMVKMSEAVVQTSRPFFVGTSSNTVLVSMVTNVPMLMESKNSGETETEAWEET